MEPPKWTSAYLISPFVLTTKSDILRDDLSVVRAIIAAAMAFYDHWSFLSPRVLNELREMPDDAHRIKRIGRLHHEWGDHIRSTIGRCDFLVLVMNCNEYDDEVLRFVEVASAIGKQVYGYKVVTTQPNSASLAVAIQKIEKVIKMNGGVVANSPDALTALLRSH